LKKAIELDPKSPSAYDNLAAALTEVGDLEPACEALKQALALTPENALPFRFRKQSLEQTETLLRLAPGLEAIAKGETKPKDFQEGLLFGMLCRLKQHYPAAIRLYEQALASDPEAAKKLAPINFVVFSRMALLASAGKGHEPPAEADQPAYRAKALTWLQRFLKTQQEELEKNGAAQRYAIQVNARMLLQHKDLSSVRPPALGTLPEGERAEWEKFWKEVEALLEKASALS
jgi:tetratricopeptide (TPR) repeat protein